MPEIIESLVGLAHYIKEQNLLPITPQTLMEGQVVLTSIAFVRKLYGKDHRRVGEGVGFDIARLKIVGRTTYSPKDNESTPPIDLSNVPGFEIADGDFSESHEVLVDTEASVHNQRENMTKESEAMVLEDIDHIGHNRFTVPLRNLLNRRHEGLRFWGIHRGGQKTKKSRGLKP